MQEAEVSLRVALYYIKNRLTGNDVMVSIDGAHVKTGDTIHFDIWQFLKDNDCIKVDGENNRWQGKYEVIGYDCNIVISSQPGIGDVNIWLNGGRKLFVESKKGRSNKASQEYPLMREAIGQLMTAEIFGENVIPAVAVPYSEKSYELATRWSEYPQIKLVGIKFILVKDNGDIVEI